jgi:NADH dehydrogenase [ubiquinone] 1 alpha subcomplex assembly factor 5
MTEPMLVFDRPLVRLRRQRLAAGMEDACFLVREVAERLLERLDDIRRLFRRVLVLGASAGLVETALAGRAGVELLVAADDTSAMLAGPGLPVVADAELLPFAPDRFDLVLSTMVLHWVNDLPGTLAQLRGCLAPDGLLLAAMPGGDTLTELRQALTRAELECEGGVSPRVSPFADVRDAGALLQRAGFALPVVDVDRITVSYADPLRLLRELGRMGESNALLRRRSGPLRRATLARALTLYQEQFGDAEGRVPATFDIVFMAAWKPDPSQQQPARRGSGRVRLADALRVPGGRRSGHGLTDPD